MRYEGDMEILSNLLRKGALVRAMDVRHYEYKTVIVGCPGGVACVSSAGCGAVLHDYGLAPAFDIAVGLSAGLPWLACFLSGQRDHWDIYWKEAATRAWISRWRYLTGKPIADNRYGCSVLRGETGREPIDNAAILRAHTQLYAGATCARTGKSILFDAKKAAPDVVRAVRAAMAMPMRGEAVAVGDDMCLDSAGALTFGVRQVVERFEPTDLLVLATMPELTRWSNYLERLALLPMMVGLPTSVQSAFILRYERGYEELLWLRRERPCRYLIVWPLHRVRAFENDPAVIRAAGFAARESFSTQMAQARAAVQGELELLAAE